MIALVKLIGIVMVILGAIYLVRPAMMKHVMRFWTKGKRPYLGGVINLIIGIIFLSVASQCVLPWFLGLVGIISIVKGVVILILGPKKVINYIKQLDKGSARTLRIMAILVLAIGILILYAV